ncbi:MAG: phosphoserine phosphatase RsbU/P [Thermoleophilaceae bacterium]|nr:phosphoserine phosphatase RsbU/P [Thermoleophilaceae bacterium]
MRARPFTRGGTALVLALFVSAAGAASAGAISVAGVDIPLTDQVHVVGGVGDTVNGVTGGVTDTVNDAVNAVNDATGNPSGVVPPDPVPHDPVGPVPNPVGGGSGGGGSGSGSTGGSGGGGSGSTGGSGGGSGSAPSVSGGSTQAGGSTGGGPQRRGSRAGGGHGSGGSRANAPRANGGRGGGAANGSGGSSGRARVRSGSGSGSGTKKESSNPIARVINTIDRVVPTPIKILIAVLALLALGFAIQSRVVAARARRLARQREALLGDVGLLQRALLPDVPDGLPGIDVSVAYRPAEGPAAGGDFYDVFELEGGRTAIIVGDVCGHGRAALAVTALMRYTLRAYLGVGFEPRVALQVAARALEGTPDGALTTVVLAIFDPKAGTLTYACAGHEPPIVLGPAQYEPVTAFSAPPLGGFMPTGQRQTTVALPEGSSVCFFTDGLVEARLGDQMIGRRRLSELLGELEPDAGAQLLLERLAASADRAPDDMAACLVRVRTGAPAGTPVRVEELEVVGGDVRGDRVPQFLAACGAQAEAAVDALRVAGAKASEFGGALIRVIDDGGLVRVEVSSKETTTLPVPSLDAARRQAALEVPTASGH